MIITFYDPLGTIQKLHTREGGLGNAGKRIRGDTHLGVGGSENFAKWIRADIERQNSKGRSGYNFDSIYKIYFAALLHQSFEVI